MNKLNQFKDIIIILLLIPFRLPISVMLIDAINYIAGLGSYDITMDILRGNVMMTKGVYDVAFLWVLIISIINRYKTWYASKEFKNSAGDLKKVDTTDVLAPALILSFCYLIFDLWSTYHLFDVVN